MYIRHNDFTHHKPLASGRLILYKSLEHKHLQSTRPCPAQQKNITNHSFISIPDSVGLFNHIAICVSHTGMIHNTLSVKICKYYKIFFSLWIEVYILFVWVYPYLFEEHLAVLSPELGALHGQTLSLRSRSVHVPSLNITAYLTKRIVHYNKWSRT